MNKKLLTLLAIPFLMTSCTAGSEGNSTSGNDIEGDFLIKEDVTIEFLCLTDVHYKEDLKKMIKEFKELEPHVSVELTNPPAAGNYNVLEKIVISGFFKEDYPDLVQCYPDNVIKYIDRGYAINLDSYLDHETYGLKEEKDDYIDTFLKEGSSYTVKGTYSLPFCKSTELMYYNADVLLGLNLSSVNASINNGQALDATYLDNLTWEVLFNDLCPALEAYNATLDEDHKIIDNSDSSAYGIFTYDSDENFFITLANQYNYGYTSYDKDNDIGSVDFDNAGMKSLMLMLNQARSKGYLQTRGSYNDGYVSDLFKKRQALFTISSTASLSYNYDENNPFNIGVAKMPHASGKEYSSINQGPSVCLLDHKNENRSLASYLFWKYITNEKNSSSWAIDTGYMGIRNSSYASEEYRNALEPSDAADSYAKAVADNLRKIAEVRTTTFNTAVFKGSSNARTYAGQLLTACLKANNLESDIDELFASYANQAKEYLD